MVPLLFLIDRRGGWRESEVGMEGLAPKGSRKRRVTLWRHDAAGRRRGPAGVEIFCLGLVTGANSRARSCEMNFRSCSKLSLLNHLAFGRCITWRLDKELAREFAPVTWIARNPLKSPESDEGIQENPSPFSWFGLVRLWVWLGGIWPEARPAIASARLRYEDAPRSTSTGP